jgi:uncharacterized integral membrane protein
MGGATWLYTWAGALVALLVILIALVVANTRSVKVSWILGSTRQSLVWIILVTATLGWLLGIATGVIFRFRRGAGIRRAEPDPHAGSDQVAARLGASDRQIGHAAATMKIAAPEKTPRAPIETATPSA